MPWTTLPFWCEVADGMFPAEEGSRGGVLQQHGVWVMH